MKMVMTKFVLLYLFLSTTASAQPSIRGLNEVMIDNWTQHLNNSSHKGRDYATSKGPREVHLFNSINGSNSNNSIFGSLFKLYSKYSYVSSQDYLKVAQDILTLRNQVQQTPNDFFTSISSKRDILYLLQIMAEEALYVGSQKFNSFPKKIILEGHSVTTSKRTYQLGKLHVQTGDVFISKSTGSGSSSLISFAAKDPHIVSHSTVAYVPADTSQLLSPEAFIEDGVRIRDLRKSFDDTAKVRVLIYRLRTNYQNAQKVEKSTDEMVDRMYKRTPDPINNAAFSYNFAMNIDPKAESFFCSAVSYDVYSKANMGSGLNPYSQNQWSPIIDGARSLFNTLGIHAKSMAAPGDIETNTNFELVGQQINIHRLLDERIENAILDNFLLRLDSNTPMMKKITERLRDIGDEPLNKTQIEQLANSGLINAKAAQSIIENLGKVPNNISAKQLVFFYLLNEVATPQLREETRQEIQRRLEQGEVVGLQKLRALARQSVSETSQGIAHLLFAELDRILPVKQKNAPQICRDLF